MIALRSDWLSVQKAAAACDGTFEMVPFIRKNGLNVVILTESGILRHNLVKPPRYFLSV